MMANDGQYGLWSTDHGGCDVILQQMLFECVNCDVVGGDGIGESDSKGDKCNGDTDQDGDGIGDGDNDGDDGDGDGDGDGDDYT